MQPPSYYKEKQDQTVLETKISNYISLSNQQEMSKSYLMDQYLRWTPDEIKANAEGLKKDIKLGFREAPISYETPVEQTDVDDTEEDLNK
jgi:hypothetical protein